MRRPDNIAFGVNDPLPARLALGLALQQLAFLGALMVIPDIYARASGLPEPGGFLNIASATLLVSALVIVLQVRALRYLGAGYYYPLQTTGAVLPGMYLVASLPGSGLDAVFGMVWVVGLSEVDTPVLAATGLPQGVRNLNDPNARGRLWLQALGSYGKVDGSHGGSDLEQRTGGAVMGLDWALGSDWRLGVLGGYSRTRLDATGLDGQVGSWHAGVYAVRQSGPLALRLGAAYSAHDGDSKRDVGFNGFSERLKGDYDADSQQAFAELGYALGSGRFSAEPFANLGYQRYHRDAYREKGGTAALAVDSDTQDNVTSTFGVRVAHLGQLDNGMSLTPRASLGWRHVYGTVDTTTRQAFIAGGDAFSVEGSALDRDSLVVEAGLELGLSATQSVSLGYNGELGSNSRNHAVMGQWQLKF